MIPRGALQQGLPTPVAIPAGYCKIIIDLKDCFFTIPLHSKDLKHFAFSLPVINFKGPMPRFHWKVLPQGMANSPTLCQKFVAQIIDPFRQRWPSTYLIHYMDDLLMADPNPTELLAYFQELSRALIRAGLQIAPDKIQLKPPYLFLGFDLFHNKILSQKVQLRTNCLKTLNDFQKLLGDINWLRPYLKLTTGELKPLFDILKEDPDPTSSRSLTAPTLEALKAVEAAILNQRVTFISYEKPLLLVICATDFTPTGVFWQEGPLFWVHLPASPPKVLIPYTSWVAELIKIVRNHSRKIFGKDANKIVLPYSPTQIQWLIENDDEWATSCTSFQGALDNHYPANKLLHFLRTQPFVFPTLTSSQPLPHAPLVFTDGSSNGVADFTIDNQTTSLQSPFHSAQLVELFAVLQVFQQLPNTPFNLYTDSAYIAQSIPLLETVPYIKPTTNATPLFFSIQQCIHSRQHPFYISHICAHSGLPGPLATGNAVTDKATQLALLAELDPVAQAKEAHSLHHLNAQTLCLLFKITREQAHQIVKQCANCVTLLPVPHLGVNPRGLVPNEIWQMDVTHVPSFGNLKYLHVTVDTFSGFIFASLHVGEASKNIIAHVLNCLSVMGKPEIIKTNNGPGYTGKKFQEFCHQLQIKHVTGIPYNPQGQGIVERAHLTIKHTFHKLKMGDLYPMKGSPRNILHHALFVLNFLTLDAHGKSAADCLWHPQTDKNYATVMWRDPLTSHWNGPYPILIWGRGSACVFNTKERAARWLPERLIKPIDLPEDF